MKLHSALLVLPRSNVFSPVGSGIRKQKILLQEFFFTRYRRNPRVPSLGYSRKCHKISSSALPRRGQALLGRLGVARFKPGEFHHIHCTEPQMRDTPWSLFAADEVDATQPPKQPRSTEIDCPALSRTQWVLSDIHGGDGFEWINTKYYLGMLGEKDSAACNFLPSTALLLLLIYFLQRARMPSPEHPGLETCF